MKRIIHDDMFRNLIATQSDSVVRSALLYGGERVFFVEDVPTEDFDMFQLGKIIIAIFEDKRHFEQALSREGGAPIAIDPSCFSKNVTRISESLEYVSSRPNDDLQRWLVVCLQKPSKACSNNTIMFDLLFFCKIMEQFFWDGKVVGALLRGEYVGGAFDLT